MSCTWVPSAWWLQRVTRFGDQWSYQLVEFQPRWFPSKKLLVFTGWTAKAIYALKIKMFHGQCKLSAIEERTIRYTLCVFGIRIYTRAWFTCSSAPQKFKMTSSSSGTYKYCTADYYRTGVCHMWAKIVIDKKLVRLFLPPLTCMK